MRIGLVSMHADPAEPPEAEIGEHHRYVGQLAGALQAAGHEVRVYTRQADPAAAGSVMTGEGVRVERGPGGPAEALHDDLGPHAEEFSGWLADRWHGGDWRPDVVHAHYWLSGVAAVAASREAIPVVQSYHSLGVVRRRWYGRAEPGSRERVRQERELGRNVRRVVAQSQAELGELTRLGVPRDLIDVVPSGVDTGRFNPKGDVAPRESGRPRIFAVGRHSPIDGFEELIAALRWVPDAELVLAGGPAPERLADDSRSERLRERAEEVGVADRVRLLGSLPSRSMPSWYRSATVFARTPRYESFGLPAVEAMACGAPVVAYAVGGLVETVVHRVTGLLVHPHDIRGLGTTLRRLLHSDVDRLAYADAAVDRAQVRYAWNRVAGELERVYLRARES
jgi:D-inositol-3-phosphate glycosyltransferase